MKLKFEICPGPDNPSQQCKAVSVLQRLNRQGQLRSYDPTEVGNCFSASLGILLDLAEANFSTNGWCYVIGECKPPQGPHAWLEYDGWAVDFSSGRQVFTPVGEFVRVKEPQGVKRYDLAEIQRLSSTTSGKSELGIFEAT